MRKRTESQQRSGAETTKRQYIIAPVVVDHGYPCPHCNERYGHKVRDVKQTSTGPRWYMRCGRENCGRNFVRIRPNVNISDKSGN